MFSLLPGESVDALFRDGCCPRCRRRGARLLAELEPEIAGTDELGGIPGAGAPLVAARRTADVRRQALDGQASRCACPTSTARWWSSPSACRRDSRSATASASGLHRRVCERFLPAEILARKKRGFAVNVVDEWFRGSLGAAARRLSARPVVAHVRVSRSGRGRDGCSTSTAPAGSDNHKMLFSLVVLEEWLRAVMHAASYVLHRRRRAATTAGLTCA